MATSWIGSWRQGRKADLRCFQWLRAIWCAAQFGHDRATALAGALSLCRALKLRLTEGKPSTGRLWRSRLLRGCFACPIYSEKFKTCGWLDGPTYFDEKTGQEKLMGCSCFIVLAAADPKKKCWLETIGLPSAWPDATVPRDSDQV